MRKMTMTEDESLSQVGQLEFLNPEKLEDLEPKN